MPLRRQNAPDAAKPPLIDSVRRNLIKKVEQLLQAIVQKEALGQINTIINELTYQAVFYFTQKEKLMLISHNSAYHHHRQEHDGFIWKLNDLQRELEAGHPSQAIAICKELQQWLSNHRTAWGQDSLKSEFGFSKSNVATFNS